jgi:hypothetical protein
VTAEVSRLEDRALMTRFDAFGYIWSNNYRNNLTGNGWYSNGQQWAPQNAYEEGGKLYLKLKTATVADTYTAVSSAELDLVGKVGNPSFTHPGFGTYLVTATYAKGWNDLVVKDKDNPAKTGNVLFGAFTYQQLPGAGSTDNNPYRELDTIEIGRFNDRSLDDPTNAQSTLQLYTKPPGSDSIYNNPNLHRFTIPDNPTTITAVMEWQGPDKPLYFLEYNKAVTLSELKSAATSVTPWKTAQDQKYLVPSNSTADNPKYRNTFHLNLWRSPFGPYAETTRPIPDSTDITVKIDNFEYDPKIVVPIPS